MKAKGSYMLLAGLLLASACSKDDDIRQTGGTGQPLSLSVLMEGCAPSGSVSTDSSDVKGCPGAVLCKRSGEGMDQPPTKAAPVETMTTYGSFSLYGYIYDSWDGTRTPNYMYGEKVQYSLGEWTTTGKYNTCLGDRKARFYGIAPYGAEGVSVPPAPEGPLNFTYTVPSAVASQNDLLVGASPEYTADVTDLSLTFGHCLSAVTFKTGAETVDGTIKSITLKGVYSKGQYTCGSGWSGLSTVSDFTFASDIPVAEGLSKELTGGTSTMMLLPQTVPSGASVEVVIESDGSSHTLSASIAGDRWLEGRRCVYSLSFDSIAGMKISLGTSSLTLEWGESRDIAVTADPSDQEWTKTITGEGLSAEKINGSTVRVTNNNISGTDSEGGLTVTTEDGRRSSQASVTAKSLQESITLSPSSKTIAYGSAETVTASGTYPGGFSLNSPAGTTVTRDGNSISVKNSTASYTASDVTLTATTALMGKTASASIHLAARPETIRFDRTEITVGTSGTGTVTASGDYDSFTAALSSTAYATLGKSGNTLTVTNRNTTYESKTVTLTATTDGDTKATATATVTLSPIEDYIIDYEITTLSLSPANVGAGGGTVTASGGTVTQKWASGKSVADYADANLTVARTAQSGTYPASVSGHAITVGSLGTDIVSQGTYTVTASFSQGGITATSRIAQFTQSANALESSNHNPSGYTAYASLGGGISAAGGSATLSYRASHSAYNLYSSGCTDAAAHTVYDNASVTLSYNGNSAFSLGGSTSGSGSSNTCTVSHSDMAGNARTDKVTVKVTNGSSASAYREVSESVTNNRYTGTRYTKDHTKTGPVTYGSKSYGTITYGDKSYGGEYIRSTDYGTKMQDADTYGSWTTYETLTEQYDYAVSFAVAAWSPDADATDLSNAVTASHYEREKYSQRRTITHNYHQTYTQHYYRDYTRPASRTYTRSASQSCNYIEYRTDTFDSGSREYVEEARTHTESWTDSGTEVLPDDTGSEWYRDNSGTSYSTSDGGYGYQTTYGTASKKTDTVTPTSGESSWLTWSGGRMYVSENTATSPRSATLSATNGSAAATCSVTQAGAEYDIEIN